MVPTPAGWQTEQVPLWSWATANALTAALVAGVVSEGGLFFSCIARTPPLPVGVTSCLGVRGPSAKTLPLAGVVSPLEDRPLTA